MRNGAGVELILLVVFFSLLGTSLNLAFLDGSGNVTNTTPGSLNTTSSTTSSSTSSSASSLNTSTSSTSLTTASSTTSLTTIPTTSLNTTSTTSLNTTSTSSSSTTSLNTTSLNTTSSTTSTIFTTTVLPIDQNAALSCGFQKSHGNFTVNGRRNANSTRVLIKTCSSVMKSIAVGFRGRRISASINVTDQPGVPSYLPAPPTQVYQAVQINGTVGASQIDNFVTNATYNFSVPKQWLSNHNAGSGKVGLYKYFSTSNSWVLLNTTVVGEDYYSYFFTSTSNTLSNYYIGVNSANSISTSKITTLTMSSGWETYFYAIGSFEHAATSVTQGSAAFNIVNIMPTQESEFGNILEANVGLTGFIVAGTGNYAYLGNYVADTSSGTTQYNTVMAGLGANVIFTHNSAITNACSYSNPPCNILFTNSLGFSVNTANSMGIILYGVGGNSISINLPTGAGVGCTLDSNVMPTVGNTAGAAVANCIFQGTGFYTTSFITRTNTAAANSFGNVITAIVFPPQTAWLMDQPGSGNIITNGTLQVNGNTILAIGDNKISAVTFGTNNFQAWQIDTTNSVNGMIAGTTSVNTLFSLMGNLILTAYSSDLKISSATESKIFAGRGQTIKLTINLGTTDTGTTPYIYNFLITNKTNGNVIFNSIISNSFTGNAVSFTIPSISANPNAIGNLIFTANVEDSRSGIPENYLVVNSFIVSPDIVLWDGSTACTNNWVGGACRGSVTYSSNTILTQFVNVSKDIIIQSGVVVTVNGFGFIAGNMFDNSGFVISNTISNGGTHGVGSATAPTAGNSLTSSYAGSGGGGGAGWLSGSSTTCFNNCNYNGAGGGSTLASGGSADVCVGLAGLGTTPAAPTVTNANIIGWAYNGFVTYFGGAGGGGGAGAESGGLCGGTAQTGGSGGGGSFGYYIQANTVIAGTTNAIGAAGGSVATAAGGGGGGGGGIILIANSVVAGSYTSGTSNVLGGAAGTSGGGDNGNVAGNGGLIDFGFTVQPLPTVPLVSNLLILNPDPVKITNTVIDVGQNSVLNTIVSNGLTPYLGNWVWSSPNTLTSGSVTNTVVTNLGGSSNSMLVFSPTTSTNAIFTFVTSGVTYSANELGVNTVYGTWNFNGNYIDSTNYNALNAITQVGITVNPSLSLSTESVSNTVADQGQVEQLSITVSGGSSPYIYNFLVTNTFTSTVIYSTIITNALTTNTVSFTLPTSGASSVGTLTFSANAVDSATTNVVTSVGTTTFTVKSQPTATLSFSNSLADSGQYQKLTAQLNAGGGTGTFTINFFNVTGGATYNSVPAVAVGGSTTNTLLLTSPTNGNVFQWNVIVTDTGTTNPFVFNSVTGSFTENAALTISTKTASNSIADQGQAELLTITISGGTAPYTYNFMASNTAAGNVLFSSVVSNSFTGNVATFTLPLAAADPMSNALGSLTFSANVVDTATTNSEAVGTTAITGEKQPTVTLSVNSIFDSGQVITFTSTHNSGGGAGTFKDQFFNVTGSTTFNTLPGVAVGGTGTNLMVSSSPTANNVFTWNVISSDTGTTSAFVFNSVSVSFAVNTAITATAASVSIDAGQSNTLFSSVSGGSSPYTNYKWYTIVGSTAPLCTSANIISGATSTSYTATPASTNSYAYQVTDSATTPNSVCSSGATVTVNSKPTVQSFTGNALLDSGQKMAWSFKLTGGANAGTGPFTMNFFNVTGSTTFNTVPNVAVGGTATNAFITSSPTDSNTFTWNGISSDTGTTSPFVFNSAQLTFTVNSPLLAPAPTASASTINFGSSVSLAASPSAGTPPYTYNWFRGGSATCSGDTLVAGATSNTYTDTPASDKYYCYAVNDLFGSINTSATTLVHVSTSGGGGGGGGGGGPPPSVTFTDNVSKAYTSNVPVIRVAVVSVSNGQTVAKLSYYQNQLPASVGYTSGEGVTFNFTCGFMSGGNTYTYQNTVYGLGTGKPCGQSYAASSSSYNVLYGVAGAITSSTSTTTTAIATLNTTSTIPPFSTTSTASSTSSQSTTIPINTTSVTVLTLPPINQTVAGVETKLNISSQAPVQVNFTNAKALIIVSTNSLSGALVRINVSNVSGSRSLPKLINQQLLKALALNVQSETATATVNMIVAYPCSIPANSVAPYQVANGNWEEITPYSVNPSSCTVAFAISRNAVVAIFYNQGKQAQPGIGVLAEAAAGIVAVVAVAYLAARYLGKKKR